MHQFLINHFALSVQDVQKSLEFYQKVFQFEEIQNTASSSRTRWLSIGEGRQLHLIPRPEDTIKTNKAVHFAFSTTNLEAVIKQLNELDISYSDWLGSPNKDYVRDDGIKQIYFQDPDAYWIEINNDAGEG